MHGWFRPHNCNTAGNGNITAFISIPYCAKHDLPSPTDSRPNKWDAGDAHAQPASLSINKHFLAITANISHLGEMTNFSV